MMKNIRKILAVLMAVILLGAAFTSSAFAASALDDIAGLFGELLNGLTNNGGAFRLSDLFGNREDVLERLRQALDGFNVGNVNNSQLLDAITRLLNGDGADLNNIDITSLLDDSFLGRLAQYIQANPLPTTEPYTFEEPTTEEPTTEEPTTEEPTTEEPATIAVPTTVAPYVPVWDGAQVYPVTTTEPTTEPSYIYVEPTQQYVPPITTEPTYYVNEDLTPVKESDSSAVKMGVGVAMALISLAAVIVVAVMLKKNRV